MTGEKKEEVSEMEKVLAAEPKELSQSIVKLCEEGQYLAAFALFREALEQSICEEADGGLFYNMAHWAGRLKLKSWLELVEIYVAFARKGNDQAGLSLTHQIFKSAADHDFMSRLFLDLGLDETRFAVLNEVLDFLIEAFDDWEKGAFILVREANRKAILEFLIRLFEYAEYHRRTAFLAKEKEKMQSFNKLLDKITIALAKEGYLAKMSGAAGTRQNMIERLGLLVFSGNEDFLKEMKKAIDNQLERKPLSSSGTELLEARRSVYFWLWKTDQRISQS